MTSSINHIVILGGGTAGWLTAGIVAAQHQHDPSLRITLVESPEIKILGVGEGTWPTMRDSLRKMGVSESAFVRQCDVSFKQGTQFQRWVNGQANDCYYHPFSLPHGYFDVQPARYWQMQHQGIPFADAVSTQPLLCRHQRAPKQKETPEFAGVVNYGYHLDAVKFADFLRRHCTEQLGVHHIVDHVVAVNSHDNGDIAALRTREQTIAGDLFIDCSGFQGQLIDRHFNIPFQELKSVLFNDSALVCQQPHVSIDAPLASATISTAQSAGWVWDIALPTRRGIGYVYAGEFQSDDQAAATLKRYVTEQFPGVDQRHDAYRKIAFRPGYRSRFWHRNCIAIGTSAGFIEPLEASALVLIELSAQYLGQRLPRQRDQMPIIARQFNQTFHYRWQRITDFLKLHYLLSHRDDSDYWRAHRDPANIPGTLREQLLLWQDLLPSKYDFPQAEEIFPAASFQYILYGMEFKTRFESQLNDPKRKQSEHCVQQNLELAQKHLQHLPSNRELLNHLRDLPASTTSQSQQ